jgi:2-iminobutanoate/2-iminopropanoate deaminase
MRPTSLALRAVAMLAIAALTAAPALAQGNARMPIGNSSATLTPAVRVGDIVYTSGQLGLSRDPADSTIQRQTRLALENIKRVLEQAGTRMDLAIKCTVFLVNAEDFQGMNSVYSEFWPSSPPARSTVVAKALVVASAKVEIECMAAMPAK